MTRWPAVAAVATIVAGSIGVGVVDHVANPPTNGLIRDYSEGANYVESPSPILASDGSVYLLHHEGFCCFPPIPNGVGWESGVNTVYPPSGPPETYVLGTTGWNDGTHEQAHFTAIKRGLWRGWYTRTVWEPDSPARGWGLKTLWESYPGENRGRISSFTSSDLVTVGDVTHSVVVPYESGCKEIGSCYGAGVLYPSVSPMPDNTLMLWVNDDVRPDPEYRNILRGYSVSLTGKTTHKIDAVFRDDNFDEVFPTTTDVGLGRDGVLYALTSRGLWTGIEEWYSEATPRREIGELWRPTGRTWVSEHGLAVWDGGYMKDDAGVIVEPRVVVGVASRYGALADSGEWQFEWWGDPGATVPERWVGSAPPATPTPTPTVTPGATPTPTPWPPVRPRLVVPRVPRVYPYTIMSWTLAGGVPHRLSMICGPVGCSMICGDQWVMRAEAWEQAIKPGFSRSDDVACAAWGAVYATIEREGDCQPLAPPSVIDAQPPSVR